MRAVLLQTLERESTRLADAWPRARRGSAEDLRQVRIATRRLRQLAAVVGRITAERRAESISKGLRAIGKAFGPVRDLAMAADFLAQYEERRDIGTDASEAKVAFERQRHDVERAARAAVKGVSIGRMKRRLGSLRKAIESAPEPANWERSLTVAVARRAADVSDALSRSSALYDPERLHAIRIAIKKLRYAAEMAAGARLVPPGIPVRLARFQKRLGAWHDRVAVLDLIRRRQAESPRASETSWRRLADVLDREAHVLHGQVRRGQAGLERSLRDLCARIAGRALQLRPAPVRARLGSVVPQRTRTRRSEEGRRS